MKLRILKAFILTWGLGALVALAGPAWAAGPVDHSLWAGLLQDYVSAGRVDYAGFKQDEARLDRYLAVLEQTDHQALEKKERFAFFVNAYNAWTVKFILTEWPDIESIKELGSIFSSPWKKEIVRLKDKTVSLDDVEHGLLRKEYRDPRVHFAVNCASKSCPPLASTPYTGKDLDERLDRAARDFLNDPQSTRLEGETLYLSKIFDWYKEDFGNQAAFVLQYAQGDFKTRLKAAQDKVKIEYLPYDWSLNKK